MKTMHLGKYFLSLGIMAFLLFSTGNAFGLGNTDAKGARSCDNGDGDAKAVGCIAANNSIVMAPYWQVDGGSYTFIAVTHSSLSGMASQIGLHVEAITSAAALYTTAQTFTISAGKTERVFIVPSTHATVNATSIPTAKFIAGTSDFTYGSVRVTPVMTHPELKWRGGAVGGLNSHDGAGFRDITMLSYWGSVIIEANTTGFAMEFIGDMNDSTALPQLPACMYDLRQLEKDTNCNMTGHITTGDNSQYNTMSTGPNLQ